MADNLGDIQQAILNKARKDKFLLILTLPPCMKSMDVQNRRENAVVSLDSLQYSVFSAPVPKISIPAVPVPWSGQTPKVTSQTRDAFGPVSVNFTIDNQFSNYWVLWKWLSFLNKPRTSGMDEQFAQYEKGQRTVLPNSDDQAQAGIRRALLNQSKNRDVPDTTSLDYKTLRMKNSFFDYMTTITTFGLDEYNRKIVRFDYYYAFITALDEISYNNRVPDEAESTFTFEFGQMDVHLVDEAGVPV